MTQNKSTYKPTKGSYDLPPQKVKRVDAIAWVAKQVHSSDPDSYGRKKVRENYGGDNKKTMINAPEFFTWAISRWSELSHIPNIPRLPVTMSMNAAFPVLDFCMGNIIEIPQERDVLEKRYIETSGKLYEMLIENQRLNAENQKLREELQQHSDRAAKLKAQKSAGGRKGGSAKRNQ